MHGKLLGLFFTGFPHDHRAMTYKHMMMNMANPMIAVNENGDWKGNNEEYLNLMLARNWHSKGTQHESGKGQQDKDVHYELVKFIQDAGRWHGRINLARNDKDDTVADALYHELESQWPKLDQQHKEFFMAFMNVIGFGGEPELELEERPSTITHSQEGISLSEAIRRHLSLENGNRLNMKRDGKYKTQFAMSIPLLPPHIVEAIWTDKNTRVPLGEDELNTYAQQQKLRDIYQTAYGEGKQWRPNNANLRFNYDVGKFLRYKLKCIKEKPVQRTVECPDECMADIPRNMYVRKDGKLMKKNPDGSEVEMGDVSKENCYTTMFEGDHESCEDFVSKCIYNPDAQAFYHCMDYLKHKKYWKITKDAVKNLDPRVLCQFLTQLGFATVEVPDSVAGRRLKKYQSVDQWLKGLYKVQGLGMDNINAIEANSTLLSVLCLYVEFINANPAVLNEGYRGPTMESEGRFPVPKLAEQLNIPPRREPSSQNAQVRMAMDRLLKGRKRSLLSLGAERNPFILGRESLMIPVNTQIGKLVVPRSLGMWGGNFSGSELYKQSQMYGSSLLKTLFDYELHVLKSLGKSLSSADAEKINRKLDNFTHIEDDLLRNLQYIECYNKMLQYFGDDSGETELSLETMQAFCDRHKHLCKKYHKYEGFMMSIYDTLTNIARGGDKGDGVVVNAPDKPIPPRNGILSEVDSLLDNKYARAAWTGFKRGADDLSDMFGQQLRKETPPGVNATSAISDAVHDMMLDAWDDDGKQQRQREWEGKYPKGFDYPTGGPTKYMGSMLKGKKQKQTTFDAPQTTDQPTQPTQTITQTRAGGYRRRHW